MITAAATTAGLCGIPGIGAAGCAAAGALVGTAPAAVGGGLIGGAASSIAGAALGQIAQAVFEAWWLLQAKVLTMWTAAPTPTAGDLAAPGRAGGYVAWLVQYVLVISVLLAAGRTILSRDGRNLADVGRTLVLTIVVSALGVTVAAALVRAGDAVAAALVRTDLADAFGGPAVPVHAAVVAAGGQGGALILGLLGALASVVQFFILLARNAVMPVVVLLLPLAAAAGGSQLGKAWFARLVAWVLALAFYKPVAAVVYAVVLSQSRSADTFTRALTALVGMFVAVLTLPALIKLFSPSPAGGGGQGGGFAASMGAGALAKGVASRGGGGAAATRTATAVPHPAAMVAVAAVTAATKATSAARRTTG